MGRLSLPTQEGSKYARGQDSEEERQLGPGLQGKHAERLYYAGLRRPVGGAAMATHNRAGVFVGRFRCRVCHREAEPAVQAPQGNGHRQSPGSLQRLTPLLIVPCSPAHVLSSEPHTSQGSISDAISRYHDLLPDLGPCGADCRWRTGGPGAAVAQTPWSAGLPGEIAPGKGPRAP